MPQYTPTQRRVLDVLADGLPHTREELRLCLGDELAGNNAIQAHIKNIRKLVRPIGQEIVCELYRGTPHYRHVRMLRDNA